MLLFLDIDGVLIGQEYTHHRHRVGLPQRDEDGLPFLAPECVARLSRIMRAGADEIVISSAWRLKGLDAMRRLWHNYRIPGEVMSLTRLIDGHRGKEILAWMDEHRYAPYLILDDGNDFYDSQRHRLIRPSFRTGLRESDVEKAYGIIAASHSNL